MDLPHAPTDSIYKWSAIAGVMAVLFCGYVKYDAYRQNATLAADFLKKEVDRTLETMPRFSSNLASDKLGLEPPMVYPIGEVEMLPPVVSLGSVAEREAYWAKTEKLDALFQQRGAQPYLEDVMQQYFARADVKSAYTKILGMSEADFFQMARATTLSAFEKQTRSEREFYFDLHVDMKRHQVALQSLWQQVDNYNSVDRLSNFGIAGGLFFIVGGFRLWWTRVQRYQDVILKADAQDAEARLLPHVRTPLASRARTRS